MKTTADEKLDSAAKHIKQAINDIAEVVIEEVPGHDEYKQDYRDGLEEMFNQLRVIRKRLNRSSW